MADSAGCGRLFCRQHCTAKQSGNEFRPCTVDSQKIQYTPQVVPGELLAVGAAALRPDADGGGVVGHGEAELLAATVVDVAGVLVVDLLGALRVDLDAVQPVRLLHLLHDLLVLPGGLVQPEIIRVGEYLRYSIGRYSLSSYLYLILDTFSGRKKYLKYL